MKKPSPQALAVAEEIQELYEGFTPESPKLSPTKRKREITRAARKAERVVEVILAKRAK